MQELNQLIGIKLLTSGFLKFLVHSHNFQGENARLPPCGGPCSDVARMRPEWPCLPETNLLRFLLLLYVNFQL